LCTNLHNSVAAGLQQQIVDNGVHNNI